MLRALRFSVLENSILENMGSANYGSMVLRVQTGIHEAVRITVVKTSVRGGGKKTKEELSLIHI